MPKCLSPATFAAFGRGKGATDNQLGCALFAPFITGDGVVCDVTLAPLTQSACAILLKPNRRSNDGSIHCWSR